MRGVHVDGARGSTGCGVGRCALCIGLVLEDVGEDLEELGVGDDALGARLLRAVDEAVFAEGRVHGDHGDALRERALRREHPLARGLGVDDDAVVVLALGPRHEAAADLVHHLAELLVCHPVILVSKRELLHLLAVELDPVALDELALASGELIAALEHRGGHDVVCVRSVRECRQLVLRHTCLQSRRVAVPQHAILVECGPRLGRRRKARLGRQDVEDDDEEQAPHGRVQHLVRQHCDDVCAQAPRLKALTWQHRTEGVWRTIHFLDSERRHHSFAGRSRCIPLSSRWWHPALSLLCRMALCRASMHAAYTRRHMLAPPTTANARR